MDEKLKRIIKEKLGIDEDVTEETLLFEFDSLMIYELAIAIEDEFDLDGDGEIPDEDLIRNGKPLMETVGQLDAYIARRTGVTQQ